MALTVIDPATEEPLDADDVWAVSCFVVRKTHRGQGLMKELLHAAVSTAREAGARVVAADGYAEGLLDR